MTPVASEGGEPCLRGNPLGCGATYLNWRLLLGVCGLSWDLFEGAIPWLLRPVGTGLLVTLVLFLVANGAADRHRVGDR